VLKSQCQVRTEASYKADFHPTNKAVLSWNCGTGKRQWRLSVRLCVY